MAEKEIILNVKVQTNTEAAIKQIMELNTQIEREKNLQKEYNQWLKEGTVSWEEYNREMELSKQHVTEYSTKIRALRKEIQNNIKVESDLRGSLVQLRAALACIFCPTVSRYLCFALSSRWEMLLQPSFHSND